MSNSVETSLIQTMSDNGVDDELPEMDLSDEKIDFNLDEPCQVCRKRGEIVCLPCKKLLCYRCAFMNGHRDHTCKEIDEARDVLAKRVEQITEMNKSKAQRLVDVGQVHKFEDFHIIWIKCLVHEVLFHKFSTVWTTKSGNCQWTVHFYQYSNTEWCSEIDTKN